MSVTDAIGVASAIVQLAQFSTTVILSARDISRNAQLKEHTELDIIQRDLDEHLQNIARRESKASTLGLDDLASVCRKIGLELRDALQKLKADEGGRRVVRMSRSLRAALMAVLSKDKINSLQQRLEAVREEIQFKLVVLISDRTEDLASAFAITNDQLLDISHQAAEHAKEFRERSHEEYRQMTNMEKKMLDSVASQNHALYELATMLSAESERTRQENVEQHDQTRERIGEVGDNVIQVRDASDQHTMHLTRVEVDVGDMRKRFEMHQEDAKREREEAAARERKARVWKTANNSIHPTDRRGRSIPLTQRQRVLRGALAVTLVAITCGAQAVKRMRDENGQFKLPIDPSKMPEVKSMVMLPHIDFSKTANDVKQTLVQVGGHVSKTSVAGFEATRGFFLGIPKMFQPQQHEDELGLGVVTTDVTQIELIDVEDIPPPQPPRPSMGSPRITRNDLEEAVPPLQPPRPKTSSPRPLFKKDAQLPQSTKPRTSSPRVAPKPPHLRSLHSEVTLATLIPAPAHDEKRASSIL